MGNTIANGNGISYQVGKNCNKIISFQADIVLSIQSLFTYKITYNNSKYGKALLAGTSNPDNSILAQNKYFNFEWKIVENTDTGEVNIFGNHTKKCEKNSLSIVEILQVTPEMSSQIKSEHKLLTHKYKNDSELDIKIKEFLKKK
jgi:hypothetical protein